MVDPFPGSEAATPETAPGGEDNLREDADRATTKVPNDLRKVLAFGVVAATVQMAILLSLLYC